MSHQKRKTYPELHFDPEIPPELDVLLDPPPVLDKDDAESHQLTFMGFAHVVQPRDFVEWIYVRDAADHRYEVTWLRRLKTRIVRRPRKYFEIDLFHGIFSSRDAEIKKVEDRTKADLSTKIKQLRGEPDKVKAETEKLEAAAKAHLEAVTDKLQREAWQKMEAQKRTIKSDVQEAVFLNSGSNYISKWTTFSNEPSKLSRTISAASTSIDRGSVRASARRRMKCSMASSRRCTIQCPPNIPPIRRWRPTRLHPS
jgi:hypothetical protein